MANYDSIDLDWTWDGDYIRGDNGDLKDTSDDYIKSLLSEIYTVIRSELNDWELHPNIATNMSDFRGEPNTREVGEDIEERVATRLVAAGVVLSEDIIIRVVPVAVSQVMVLLTINAVATPANGLVRGEPLSISLLYDTMEDSVFFLEPSKNEKLFR